MESTGRQSPSVRGSDCGAKTQRAAFRSKLAAMPLTTTKLPAQPHFTQSQYPQFTCPIPLSDVILHQTHINSVRFIQGAYGSVSQCRLRDIDGNFAVKTVKITSPELLRAAINEYEMLSQLCHPNIVSVNRLFLDAETSTAHIVMEYLPGPSLSQLLSARHRFTHTEVQSIARQLLSALAHLHSKGLVHRDISPGNVVIVAGVVKLVDFQTACSTRQRVQRIAGTAPFQAPEMWGVAGYGCEVDVWSAGAVISKLLSVSEVQTSPEGLHFLSQSAQAVPSERLKAAEALQHSWLI